MVRHPDKRKEAAQRRLERVWEQVQRVEISTRQKRDAAIKTAHDDGMTIREIAAVTGLSHGRVGQIVSER